MKSRWRRAGSCGIFLFVLVAGMVTVTRAGEADRPAADDAQALAATIDRMIAAHWADEQVSPAPTAGDAEFLRRVALDLTGKIPAAGEVRDFLDDPRPDKRRRLVDHLLDSPAYVGHFTNIERRLLLPEADSTQQALILAPSFDAWLRQQIVENAGCDRIVRAILTAPVTDERTTMPQQLRALGRYQEPTPLPFYVAKEVKSENLAASTARIFLGLRVECAQCHNHPFASWTREQFWGYAAFFTSLERQGPENAFLGPIREIPDRREVAIPGTEKVVQATLLDGTEPRWQSRVPARMTLADWMTAPDNPFFARATVNRIWAQLFGVGLVDPVDDMGADNPPSHPELLDALARAFAAHGFDRKYLIRAIALSAPYQLSSAVTEPNPTPSTDQSRLFARMAVRGLTAEQLYDSLAQAIGLTVEEQSSGNRLNSAGTPRAEFREKFARHDEKPTETQTSILQALALMNGRLVSGATSLEQGATLAAVCDAPFLDTAGQVETLFLATLSRQPRAEESARLVAYVERRESAKDRRTALSDVFWALLNSPEFLLNH